jgi:D-cysteine desulfhydrase family pyridoxal phosphate-dependent enzyme
MIKSLNRVPLAHLPTPVEYLERLTNRLGGPKLMVKRDDQTGLAFGGNKTRKLEYLVAEAISGGARTLITAGAVQSNHCRQTAAAAIRYGLNCILVLAGDPPQNPSANFFLDLLFNVDVIWTDWENRVEALQTAYVQAENAGKHPYLVPYGGSSPTGAAGYAYAIQELMTQKISADWIVFPSSSGGTQAGLVAGARLFNYSGKILGISVDEPEFVLKEKVAILSSKVSHKLGRSITIAPDEVLVNADYCEAGYGVVTDNEIKAISLFARQEGLLLDPVYTGRAAGGLINLIENGFFSPEDTVLFWHTGGTPALFAHRYRDIIDRI